MVQESKPTVMIRRAIIEDAALLADLGTRTFDDTFAIDNNPEDMTAYTANTFTPARLEAEVSDSRATFFIAEVAGKAAGYARLHRGDAPSCITGDTPIEVARLYVHREWFGRGVGESLMRAMVEEAKAAGHKTIWLGVWEHNPRAQAFYRKWEFTEVGEQTFQLGSDAQRDVLMERRLSPIVTAKM